MCSAGSRPQREHTKIPLLPSLQDDKIEKPFIYYAFVICLAIMLLSLSFCNSCFPCEISGTEQKHNTVPSVKLFFMSIK